MSRNAPIQKRAKRIIHSALVAGIWAVGISAWAQTPAPTNTPATAPPRTTNAPHAQVVVVEDPEATYDLQPLPGRIDAMIARAMTNLTGKAEVSNAWRSLVSPEDVIGIKVNSAPGPNSGTRPVVVATVIQNLLAAGMRADHIIVWDKRALDLRLAGYFEFEQRFGIKVLGAVESGYDDKVFYETAFLGPMNWSDVEFAQKGPGVGRKSYVSKLVAEKMTKIINISTLMHHNIVGVTGNIFSLSMSSVDNTTRFANSPIELSKSVPEIYALPVVGDKVVLNIVDALICQYEGQQQSLLHYSAVLNQLRFSKDPVALDVLSLKEIVRQSELAGERTTRTNMDLLSNASLLEIGVSDPKRIDVTTLKMESR